MNLGALGLSPHQSELDEREPDDLHDTDVEVERDTAFSTRKITADVCWVLTSQILMTNVHSHPEFISPCQKCVVMREDRLAP